MDEVKGGLSAVGSGKGLSVAAANRASRPVTAATSASRAPSPSRAAAAKPSHTPRPPSAPNPARAANSAKVTDPSKTFGGATKPDQAAAVINRALSTTAVLATAATAWKRRAASDGATSRGMSLSLRRGSSELSNLPNVRRRPSKNKERDAAIETYSTTTVGAIKTKLKFPDKWCDYSDDNAAYKGDLAKYSKEYQPVSGETKPTEKEYKDYRKMIETLQDEPLYGINLERLDEKNKGKVSSQSPLSMNDADFFKLLFFTKGDKDHTLRNRHRESGKSPFRREVECGALKKKIRDAKNTNDITEILAPKDVAEEDQTVLINILHASVSRHKDAKKLPFTFYKWIILAELALIERQMALLMVNRKVYIFHNPIYNELISPKRQGWVQDAKEQYKNIAQQIIEVVTNTNLACLKQLEMLHDKGQLNIALTQPAMEEFFSKFAPEIDFSDVSLSRMQLNALKELDESLVKNKDRRFGNTKPPKSPKPPTRFGKVMVRADTASGKTHLVEKIIIPKYGNKIEVVSIDLNSSEAQLRSIVDGEARFDKGQKDTLYIFDEAYFYGPVFGKILVEGWCEGFGIEAHGKTPEVLLEEVRALEKASLQFIRKVRTRGANVLILGASESFDKVQSEIIRLDVELYQEEFRAHNLNEIIAENKKRIKQLSAAMKGKLDYDNLKRNNPGKLKQARFWSENPDKKSKLQEIIKDLRSADIFTEDEANRFSQKITNHLTTEAIREMEPMLEAKAKSLAEDLFNVKKELVAKIGLVKANLFFKTCVPPVSDLAESASMPKKGQSLQEISVTKIERRKQKLELRREVLADLKKARKVVEAKFDNASFVEQGVDKYSEDNLAALVANDSGLNGIFDAKDGGPKPSNQRLQIILPDFYINQNTCTNDHLQMIQRQLGADIIMVPHVIVMGEGDRQTSKMGCRIYYRDGDSFTLTGPMPSDQADTKFKEIRKAIQAGGAEPNVVVFFSGNDKKGTHGGNVIGGDGPASIGITQQRIYVKGGRYAWTDFGQWVGRNRNSDNSGFKGLEIVCYSHDNLNKEGFKKGLEEKTRVREEIITLAHLNLKVEQPGPDVELQNRDPKIGNKKARNIRILEDYEIKRGVGEGSLTAYIDEQRAIFRGAKKRRSKMDFDAGDTAADFSDHSDDMEGDSEQVVDLRGLLEAKTREEQRERDAAQAAEEAAAKAAKEAAEAKAAAEKAATEKDAAEQAAAAKRKAEEEATKAQAQAAEAAAAAAKRKAEEEAAKAQAQAAEAAAAAAKRKAEEEATKAQAQAAEAAAAAAKRKAEEEATKAQAQAAEAAAAAAKRKAEEAAAEATAQAKAAEAEAAAKRKAEEEKLAAAAQAAAEKAAAAQAAAQAAAEAANQNPTVKALRERIKQYRDSLSKGYQDREAYLEIAVGSAKNTDPKTKITSDILRFEKQPEGSESSTIIIGGQPYPKKFNPYYLRFNNLEFYQDPETEGDLAKTADKKPIFGAPLHVASYINCKFINIDFSKVELFSEMKFYGNCIFENCNLPTNTRQSQFATTKITKDGVVEELKCQIIEGNQDKTEEKMASFIQSQPQPQPQPSSSVLKSSDKPSIIAAQERLLNQQDLSPPKQ